VTDGRTDGQTDGIAVASTALAKRRAVIMRHLRAVSDTEDDEVLEHIGEESTGDWCETWNKVLYEWQVNWNGLL